MGRRILAFAIALNLTVAILAAGQAAAGRGSDERAGDMVDISSRPDGAFDLRYRSIDVDGDGIVLTAVLWLPFGDRSGHVVAWGHATAGLVDECAPSVEGDFAPPGLDRLLAAGHVVVAPDYEGLRSRGVHPYLVGRSEGRSVLDALRAAREVSRVRGRSAVFGWSQGGHAAVFAARMAPSYAPGVRLAGVVGIAPVTDVASLVDGPSYLASVPGAVATIAAGYLAVYPELEAGAILDAPARQLDAVRSRCDATAALQDTTTSRAENSWRRRLAQNDVGGLGVGVPVLFVQGELDLVIPLEDTVAAYGRLCARGSDVRLDRYEGVDHLSVLSSSIDSVLDWIDERFDGEPAAACAQRVIPGP